MHAFEFFASVINDEKFGPLSFDIHRCDLDFEEENYVIAFKYMSLPAGGVEIDDPEISVGDVLHLTPYSEEDVLNEFLTAYRNCKGADTFKFALNV